MKLVPFAGHDPDEEPLSGTGHVSGRHGANSTHCKRGHEFTPSNTYWFLCRKWNTRRCRTCQRENATARYAADAILREKKKARAKAHWHNTRKLRCTAQ